MLDLMAGWFEGMGVEAAYTAPLSRSVAIAAIIALAVIANFVSKRLILRAVTGLIKRSETKWDDAVLKRNVLRWLSHLAPAIVIHLLAPLALEGQASLIAFTASAVEVYAIFVVTMVIDSALDAAMDVYETHQIANQIPIKGFGQVAKLLLYFVAAVLLLSIALDKTPLFLLSGLGAFTAVLMIVFRDAILGFVAGIQLSANKMIARGDWIEMPKSGADGEVIEVSLTTVKVQNWDKTITTIPTYGLIAESFKNWRGMSEAKARRIKRSVNIDIGSIKFCTEEMLERFSKIRFISEYIEAKKAELATSNAGVEMDNERPANGRRLTNVGTFRAYVQAYLKQNPKIDQEQTFLVRQLPASELGLPIEIYVFSNDIVWAHYEAIQADIFDHLLAVAPEFDLRIFQSPSGADVKELAPIG